MKIIALPTLWDRKYITLFVFIILFGKTICAQQKLPIIRATSNKVDVQDGEIYQKSAWNLSPEVKLDIYNALEPINQKIITFYTDIDSISFDVTPGNVYDFIILLNNKDSCHTRISTLKSKIETNTVFPTLIEPELLKQDFAFFCDALQKDHAGLYRYKSKMELDKLFDSCRIALDHPMSQLEYAKTIMFLINSIEDGHTGTNIPKLLMNYYKSEKMFPAYISFIDKEAYVLCSMFEELSAGTEILSIDNKSIYEIKKELFQYLPSDGKIETKKNHILNDGTFPILYSWIFGKKDSFKVTYKTEQGKIKTAIIKAVLFKDFECDNGKDDANNTKNLQLDFLPDRIALLTIKTFDDNRLGREQNFKSFLETSFNEINTKKVENLIVDLRGNGGGADEYGALLYSYLTNKPFKYFSSIESTTSKIPLEENPLLGIQQPQKNSYNGKVLFLINGLCFSTTADFCAIAKSNNRGKFVGEETGGGYYGNTSGQIKTVELPNSKISIKIPRLMYVNDVKNNNYADRGVIPDYTIIPNINEIIHHKDIQLDFAFRLANGN